MGKGLSLLDVLMTLAAIMLVAAVITPFFR